jgi:hypothetical protein
MDSNSDFECIVVTLTNGCDEQGVNIDEIYIMSPIHKLTSTSCLPD